ncbi:Nramp family divalent metal transporter [Pseudonocardia alaniniphila]|uniref:Nramp family divalent metal transporter n=1 Tax=Pseudonocardia alaniniphila TaxID=75291 RepID=A0ABS9TCU6_9PSEU|nr:Nramp family divalent metal transporter [Pseudonocardia alaniniphila]MCH6166364.1 Nramp family divalent metal transporter [Pseudonocardia alaniniphila]
MAESVESSTLATELPSKYLPAVRYRDLPEPSGLRRYMGASIILTATALGSGELVLWPYITTQVGLGIVWLAVVGITMQFFLNMEIERYTLITGETAVTGFSRMWLPWGIVFVLGAILPNAWPGWASSGATVFTFIFSLSESAVPLVATIFLISIGLAVTISPVIYQTLEKIEGFMIALILIFVVTAIAVATTGDAWAQVVTDIPDVTGNLSAVVASLGAASLFGAIVFAGAGGANNLVQSNYIRDKGMGMGINIPNIVSPVTGQEVAAPSLGYMVPTTKENERRWRAWWRIANWEQLITFWFIGALLLVSLSVLVVSTIGTNTDLEGGLSFLQAEGRALGDLIGPWFTTAFYVAGFLMLFSTNIGVIDYVSRLAGDSLKVTFLKESTFWSESKIYITVVWVMIIAGSGIIWTGIEPVLLLIISSAGGGFVMAIYSVLIIMLNRRHLPEFAKLKGWRLPVMILIAMFYIAFSLFLTYQMITQGPASVT